MKTRSILLKNEKQSQILLDNTFFAFIVSLSVKRFYILRYLTSNGSESQSLQYTETAAIRSQTAESQAEGH